ncbi:hypothetical protein BCR42DRAFT_440456 [Absidia repens]|uniref:F-box domain-containing protein n=1 Tax=Absidia repens TaxID=90262 RepID=A0A1X2I882_9FUNG|nr:hypothetical protein BCR42DRAFT_440456 [Absidia repens]
MATATSATTFNKFPTELIKMIVRGFSQWELYQCSLVNKVFHYGTMPLLWQTVHLYGEDSMTKFRAGLNEQQQAAGPVVRVMEGLDQLVCTLDLQNGTTTDEDMFALMKQIPSLQRLVMSQQNPCLTELSFHTLPQYWPHLTTLYLVNASLSPSAFDALGAHCPQLRNLTLHNCTGLTATTFASLQPCPLEKLSIGYFSDTVWEALDQEVQEDKDEHLLLNGFGRLTHVALWSAPPIFVMHSLENARWPRLTHFKLDVLQGGLRDDQGILAFLRNHQRLICLDLSHGRFTDVVLNTITNHLPRLMFLDISQNPNVRRVGVNRLAKQLEYLCFVHLTFCGLSGKHFPEVGFPRNLDRSGPFALNRKAIKKLQDADKATRRHQPPPTPWLSPAARRAAEEAAAAAAAENNDDDKQPTSVDPYWWKESRWLK